MRSLISTLFNWKVVHIPLHAGLLVVQTGENRHMAYRDWYVFGLRVARYQLFVR